MMRQLEFRFGKPWDQVLRETRAGTETIADAASRLGVSVDTIRNWERALLAEESCAGCAQ